MRELALTAVIALAAYRAWALLALDRITVPVRRRLFTEARQDRRVYEWLKLFVKCPWCAGFWITVAITILTDRLIDDGVPAPVLVAVAASAGTALLGGNDDRLHESDESLGYAPPTGD